MSQCPACLAPLRLVVERGIDIDVCDQCRSVWFDPGESELMEMIRPLQDADRDQVEFENLKCPRCRTRRFSRHETPAGPIAQCLDCGGIVVRGEIMDRMMLPDKSSPKRIAGQSVVDSVEFLGIVQQILRFLVAP